MELTYTPSINNFDEDEWTDWMLENVNAVNKSDLSEKSWKMGFITMICQKMKKENCIVKSLIRLLIAAMTFATGKTNL